MSPSEPASSLSSAHLDFLRGQVRTALLTKKRGEARHLLGQLVSLAGDTDAEENMKALIGGVTTELAAYESLAGSIHERLIVGTSHEDIQAELDKQIPHWRAFSGDIPVLLMAGKPVMPPQVFRIRVLRIC